MKQLLLALLGSALLACGSCTGSTTDAGADGDSDNDADSENDTDSDTDNDANSDADSDSDTDSDSDSDSDSDNDSDNDADSDSDSDADTDADADSDSDSDSDSDADSDTDAGDNEWGYINDFIQSDVPIDKSADQLDDHYYISNNGDDDNSGLTPDAAWATLANIPRSGEVAVHFERGSSWIISSGLRPAAGSVYTAYGDGPRPSFYLKPGESGGFGGMAILMPQGDNLIEGLKLEGEARLGVIISSDGNIVRDCELNGAIDGKEYGEIEIGFSIKGENNRVLGNYVHDLSGMSGDSGDVNTSGGSEAYVVNGSNNEVAYNAAVNCWGPNTTLNGAEGGCLEIIVGESLEVVENVRFHHNYCERSVGLFEGCAGNFGDGPDPIQFNHAVIKDTYIAYNLSIDAMWLYLLQPVNTDFINVVFEHNTLIHGAANDDIPQGGAGAFGLFFDQDPKFPHESCETDEDCDDGMRCFEGNRGSGKLCHYEGFIEAGDITVRNNLFVVKDDDESGMAMMAVPPGENDYYNNVFVPSKPWGVDADVIAVKDPKILLDELTLASDSPIIDIGSPDASEDDWRDFKGNPVPCGDAPEPGAFEYCP